MSETWSDFGTDERNISEREDTMTKKSRITDEMIRSFVPPSEDQLDDLRKQLRKEAGEQTMTDQTSTSIQASPRPWKMDNQPRPMIQDADGEFVTFLTASRFINESIPDPVAEINNALIVTAVNTHDTLTAQNDRMRKALKYANEEMFAFAEWFDKNDHLVPKDIESGLFNLDISLNNAREAVLAALED